MASCQGAKGTGTLYSYAQLEGLWINAGGSKTLAPVMAAIAEAESGGCSTAYNPSGATGLWQILGAVNPADQNSLTDPAVNAREAVLKYQSQGLTAWTTYTSGAYKQYLNGSTTPDTNTGTGSSDATLTSYNGAACLLGFPGVGSVLGLGGGIGGFCILSKSEARGLIGGLMIGVGGLFVIAGTFVLAAAAFQRTGAIGKAADAAAVLPGGGTVAAGLTAAQRRVNAGSKKGP